jgi:hypothetical protein
LPRGFQIQLSLFHHLISIVFDCLLLPATKRIATNETATMAMRGGPRLQVGSAAWIAEERDSALNIARSEIEEFSFSARNEMDWLNEHMAEIFSENQMCVDATWADRGGCG